MLKIIKEASIIINIHEYKYKYNMYGGINFRDVYGAVKVHLLFWHNERTYDVHTALHPAGADSEDLSELRS